MAGIESRDHRRGLREPRHTLGEAVIADRDEIIGAAARARLAGRKHQRHAIQDQRFDNPDNEPLTETDDVEIAVQIAGEGDERAAVVVAIAIERAIERVL